MKILKSLSFKLLTLAMVFCCSCFYSYAGEWVDEYVDPVTEYEVIDGYKYEDGNVVKDSWRWIDDNQDGVYECYFFDKYGRKQKGGTTDGKYIDKEGRYSPAPRYEVKHWEPTDDEINEIWIGLHLDMGYSVSKVSSYYTISDIDDEGFKLEYKHRNHSSEPYKTDVYEMKWIDGKMAAVYTEFKHGDLVDFMELSIGPDFELDVTYYQNISTLSMLRRNLEDGDEVELTDDGRIKDMI